MEAQNPAVGDYNRRSIESAPCQKLACIGKDTPADNDGVSPVRQVYV
jgi:hypothetical protein